MVRTGGYGLTADVILFGVVIYVTIFIFQTMQETTSDGKITVYGYIRVKINDQ